MRIGFDAKRAFHNGTGLGNYSRDLLRILAKLYPKNTYYLYNPKKSRDKRYHLADNNLEILPKSTFWKKFSSIWRQRAIVKQLVEDKIEVYHGLSGELPRSIHKTNIKTLVTIHDLIFVRYPELYSFFDRKIHFNKFKHAAQVADIVIAISEQTKRDIVAFLKINPSKIKVIYQGCSNAFKKDYNPNIIDKTKERFNLPDNFILNVGTIEERKNVLNLVKAIQNIDTKLVVIGGDKSNYAKKVKQYISDYNLSNKVLFLKNVDLEALAIIYKLADIFVYPSIFEGFGIPIIEALYSKTAVITSKDGCFSEAGGKNSIYIDPSKPLEIETAIQQIRNNPTLKKEMEEKGHTFVQQFNDDIIAKNIYNLYT